MADILDKIVLDKKREVALKREIVPTYQLERSALMGRKSKSLGVALKGNSLSIIAEHKRRSPSKPNINCKLSVDFVVESYDKAGACAVSVLTDGKYFGGSLDDLLIARATTDIPLLRKEFIIDTYQILESKAYGADVILLIAALLSEKQIIKMSEFAKSIGLEVLLEVRNAKEIDRALCPGIDMIGVNNRNLKTFEIDINTSKQLATKIPDGFIKVSESGIDSAETITDLGKYGYSGFLIGENLMKNTDPGKSALQLIRKL